MTRNQGRWACILIALILAFLAMQASAPSIEADQQQELHELDCIVADTPGCP